MGKRGHKLGEPVEALLDHLARRRVVDLRGRRSGALGVDERERRREAHLAHERQRVLEVLLGLAGKAHDDVGRECDAGHGVLDAARKREEVLAGVAAVHGLEHARGAALHGQVQLRHDGLGLGHRRDGLVGEVLGMRARESDALDARLPHRAQELGEARVPVDVAAIGVDVLAKQAHLAHAVGAQAVDLGHDVLEATAALASAHVGHDAVAAKVVAARHDGHPGVPGVLATARQVGREAGIVLGDVGHDLPRATLERVGDELGQARESARAEHDIDVPHVLADAHAVALGDAAAHAHDAPAAWGLGGAHHGRDLAIEVRVSLLAHAAGHEDDDVGLVGGGDLDAAAQPQEPRDALGVVEVHLAAEGLDVVRKSGERCGRAHYATTFPADCSRLVASEGVRRCT